jgi:hypothetical protein
MKKIALLILITAFAFATANAQVTKETNTWTWSGCFIVDCTGEMVCGEVLVTDTYWFNANGNIKKYQQLGKGELETESGDVYTLSSVINDHAWNWWYNEDTNGAKPNTYVSNWVWEMDGMPVGVSHITWHMTVNANGEVTVDVVNQSWECY